VAEYQLNITGDNSTGQIRIDYLDLSGSTQRLQTYVYEEYNQTPTYTSDVNASNAAISYMANTSRNYVVKVIATTNTSTEQITQAITFNNGWINLHLPDTILDQNKQTWTTVASLILLTLSAYLFGAYFAGLANIVVFSELLGFIYFGWIIMSWPIVAFIGVIAFITQLTIRRHVV